MRTGEPAAAVRPRRRVELVAGLAVLLGAAALLWWAKWAPYSVKVPIVAASHDPGDSILTGGADAPPGVSLSAGLACARTYFLAVWPALVTGLLIAAAADLAAAHPRHGGHRPPWGPAGVRA